MIEIRAHIPRLLVSDECSDTPSEPRSERAGVKRTLRGRSRNRYGIGETPALNRHGTVTNAVCSSHGNDTDSDGACVTGPQPYSEGEHESFAGMLPGPSECGLDPKCRGSARQSSGGRMPRSSGRGGGQPGLYLSERLRSALGAHPLNCCVGIERESLDVGPGRIHTVGYNYVKIFGTPGCRDPSRDYSQQYHHAPSAPSEGRSGVP